MPAAMSRPTFYVPPDPRLARLARRGRLFSLATLAVLALLVAGGLGLWLRPEWVVATVVPRIGVAGYPITLGTTERAIGCAISAVPLAILGYGLFQVHLIFRDFGRGEIISEALSRRLERFGGAVMLQALLSPLAAAALSVTLTVGNPEGERLLAVTFSSYDVVAILVGLLLIGIGTVLREAARIARENAGFI